MSGASPRVRGHTPWGNRLNGFWPGAIYLWECMGRGCGGKGGDRLTVMNSLPEADFWSRAMDVFRESSLSFSLCLLLGAT